jgi:prepilin signal peptidase PulO-like enzyme (type II secretory pathway)
VSVSDRLPLVVVPAAALAAADLIVKASVPTAGWAFHHRSDAWVALSIVLLVGALGLIAVPSRAVALAGGVMCGGVIGNLVSARWEGNRVPNPLVIGHYGHGVAFNLADVFFLLGNLMLMAALIAVVFNNRDRLPASREWERELVRRLRS